MKVRLLSEFEIWLAVSSFSVLSRQSKWKRLRPVLRTPVFLRDWLLKHDRWTFLMTKYFPGFPRCLSHIHGLDPNRAGNIRNFPFFIVQNIWFRHYSSCGTQWTTLWWAIYRFVLLFCMMKLWTSVNPLKRHVRISIIWNTKSNYSFVHISKFNIQDIGCCGMTWIMDRRKVTFFVNQNCFIISRERS